MMFKRLCASRLGRNALVIALLIVVGGASCMARDALYGGEGFGISAGNLGSVELESVEVAGVGADQEKYAMQAGARPLTGPQPSFASGDTPSDLGKRIPEKVAVSWRDLPENGQPSYTGTQHGPHIVDIRSRIPAEVLSQARKRGFMVEISLEIPAVPIVMNWQLVESRSITGSGNGVRFIRQGGDSFK